MKKTLIAFFCTLIFVLLGFASVFMDVHYKGYPLGLSLAYHFAVIATIAGLYALAVFIPMWRMKRRVQRRVQEVINQARNPS